MEVTPNSETQLIITGAGTEHPLILSAEAAAQLFANAGLQLTEITDAEPVVIDESEAGGLVEGTAVVGVDNVLSSLDVTGAGSNGHDVTEASVNDGSIVYIDPSNPSSMAFLQQAGLIQCEDGTLQTIDQVAKLNSLDGSGTLSQELYLSPAEAVKKEATLTIVPDVQDAADLAETSSDCMEPMTMVRGSVGTSSVQDSAALAAVLAEDPSATQELDISSAFQTVQDDQQIVYYSISSDDGKTQQYMMLCPKNMDHHSLINTLIKQTEMDNSYKGKRYLKIIQPNKLLSSALSSASKSPTASTSSQSVTKGSAGSGRALSSVKAASGSRGRKSASSASSVAANNKTIVVQSSNVNSPHANAAPSASLNPMVTTTSASGATVLDLGDMSEEARVFIRCNYCSELRSPINRTNWEALVEHIMPVHKEELQTTFYGDLGKHFIRCQRIQLNGKQLVRSRLMNGVEECLQQCEVILTHSLVCRRTKKEFIVAKPDADFVASLAKHIRITQPGQGTRGNSLLCIFCNSPFTYEDYIKHINPHLEAILASLSYFAGAYCAKSYSILRMTSMCSSCQQPEAVDLRFLPCCKFSSEFQCLSKLQVTVECFTENYGESGVVRPLNITLSKCSVCKNSQLIYCTVFNIAPGTPTMIDKQPSNEATTLSVCLNCQKQFINIVIKEMGFDQRLRMFRLRNIEQIKSCLSVVLGHVKHICKDKKTLIYTVHDNSMTNSDHSTNCVHSIKGAEVVDISPITKLIAHAEGDIASHPVKVFYVCNTCLFTVDLTSFAATPSNRLKNDLLMAIILEHLMPNYNSLLATICSAANSRAFNLRFEIMVNVKCIGDNGSMRQIMLSLKKKLHSQLNQSVEVPLEKDDDFIINAIKSTIKADRRSHVNVRDRHGAGHSSSDMHPTLITTTASTQQVEINKFIEKNKSKLRYWSTCACNTSLLSSFIECRLCSKHCLPDYRLLGTNIDMCENCVDSVLHLCPQSDPECLEIGQECLALRDERYLGHHLVLSTNQKKWLSVDGVNVIRKMVEEYRSLSFLKTTNCFQLIHDAFKQHLLAALKTCLNDQDILSAVTGFTLSEAFFNQNSSKDASAAALASLSKHVDMPLKMHDSDTSKPMTSKEKQIEVKILSRRPANNIRSGNSTKINMPIPVRFGQKLPTSFKTIIKNGTVIDLGGGNSGRDPSNSSSNNERVTKAKIIFKSSNKSDDEEESLSAIQSFINETSKKQISNPLIQGEVRVPAGIKITSAGKGVVNIRAISEIKTVPKKVVAGSTLISSSSSGQLQPRSTSTTAPAHVKKNVKGAKNRSKIILKRAADTEVEQQQAQNVDLTQDEDIVSSYEHDVDPIGDEDGILEDPSAAEFASTSKPVEGDTEGEEGEVKQVLDESTGLIAPEGALEEYESSDAVEAKEITGESDSNADIVSGDILATDCDTTTDDALQSTSTFLTSEFEVHSSDDTIDAAAPSTTYVDESSVFDESNTRDVEEEELAPKTTKASPAARSKVVTKVVVSSKDSPSSRPRTTVKAKPPIASPAATRTMPSDNMDMESLDVILSVSDSGSKAKADDENNDGLKRRSKGPIKTPRAPKRSATPSSATKNHTRTSSSSIIVQDTSMSQSPASSEEARCKRPRKEKKIFDL